MAMSLGSAAGREKTPTPSMNVTPLVDVVLVLLIIFMVITPLMNKNFWVHTPKQETVEVERPSESEPPLVLQVRPDRTLAINGSEIAESELVERLRRMFAARDDHVLFVDAAGEVPYGWIVSLLDRAREGGAVTIAPLTKPLASEPGALQTGGP